MHGHFHLVMLSKNVLHLKFKLVMSFSLDGLNEKETTTFQEPTMFQILC